MVNRRTRRRRRRRRRRRSRRRSSRRRRSRRRQRGGRRRRRSRRRRGGVRVRGWIQGYETRDGGGVTLFIVRGARPQDPEQEWPISDEPRTVRVRSAKSTAGSKVRQYLDWARKKLWAAVVFEPSSRTARGTAYTNHLALA